MNSLVVLFAIMQRKNVWKKITGVSLSMQLYSNQKKKKPKLKVFQEKILN